MAGPTRLGGRERQEVSPRCREALPPDRAVARSYLQEEIP